jgi:hypothetical protein
MHCAGVSVKRGLLKGGTVLGQDIQCRHFLVVAAGDRSEFFTSISQTARKMPQND